MRRLLTILALALGVTAAVAPVGEAGAQSRPRETPAELADALLAADRAFSLASGGTDAASGISAMFAEDVVMPVPGAGFTATRAEALAALRANPLNLSARAEWTPVRAGVSADGMHGFTMGYMVLRDSASEPRRAKYLSYWVRRPEGWRVAVYKRGAQGEGNFSTAPMPPVVPAALLAPSADGAALQEHRRTLDAAERAFSDEAQAIGLGPAFCKNGAPDATNLGGASPAIISGVENVCAAIGASVPDAPPGTSPVTWQPDDVLVATSGDLGITWGMIRPKAPVAEGQPAGFPYTTVWHRAGPDQPWKYVAE